jgi:hypothetical protein
MSAQSKQFAKLIEKHSKELTKGITGKQRLFIDHLAVNREAIVLAQKESSESNIITNETKTSKVVKYLPSYELVEFFDDSTSDATRTLEIGLDALEEGTHANDCFRSSCDDALEARNEILRRLDA